MTFGKRHARLIDAMPEGEWASTAELAEATGQPVASTGQHLAHMARRGWVARVYSRKGRWQATPEGRHLAEMRRVRVASLGLPE